MDYEIQMLAQSLPIQCVLECSGQGDKTNDCEGWVSYLKLNKRLPINAVRKKLIETGAWSLEELESEPEFDTAVKWLWVTCNDYIDEITM